MLVTCHQSWSHTEISIILSFLSDFRNVAWWHLPVFHYVNWYSLPRLDRTVRKFSGVYFVAVRGLGARLRYISP